MNHGLSDQVRAVALENYIAPALRAGRKSFSVAVRDLMQDLQARGFPRRNYPQICTAIQTDRFLRANGLEIEAVEGPPSKLSTTVVVKYRVANAVPAAQAVSAVEEKEAGPAAETPEEWAHRLTGQLWGLLREEITAMGGADAFLRWVRSEDEEDATESAA